jgi:hypothetical protein
MINYEGPELQRVRKLGRQAALMVSEDKFKYRDRGSCVLGAGIAIYSVHKGSRKPKMELLTQAPFQGNVGSFEASERALRWLKEQAVDCFWYDGIID